MSAQLTFAITNQIIKRTDHFRPPALWTRVSVEEWPEWVQPTGAQDAYMAGDKVAHNDKHWESAVDNNTWEPSEAVPTLWTEV